MLGTTPTPTNRTGTMIAEISIPSRPQRNQTGGENRQATTQQTTGPTSGPVTARNTAQTSDAPKRTESTTTHQPLEHQGFGHPLSPTDISSHVNPIVQHGLHNNAKTPEKQQNLKTTGPESGPVRPAPGVPAERYDADKSVNAVRHAADPKPASRGRLRIPQPARCGTRETPAAAKARRRKEETQYKQPYEIVSDQSIQFWLKRQRAMIFVGYSNKVTRYTPEGQIQRQMLHYIHPDKQAHRSNGYNIARIHGIADMAQADECTAAALLTLTLPGRMHSSYRGYPNPLWDYSTPEDGHMYFTTVTKNIRQRLERLHAAGKIQRLPKFYRAMEAHKDGTPHQHWVIFYHPDDQETVKRAIHAAYKPEDKAHGRRRITFEVCRHLQGAQSYIRKYVTKNTKGLSPGFKNQRVWRSIWGIRAFGTSQGLRAGVYNQLRRFLPPGEKSDCPPELADGVTLARANKMADTSRWADETGTKLLYEPRRSFRNTTYRAIAGLIDSTTGEVWVKPRWNIEPVFRRAYIRIEEPTTTTCGLYEETTDSTTGEIIRRTIYEKTTTTNAHHIDYTYNSLYEEPGPTGPRRQITDLQTEVKPEDVFEDVHPEYAWDPITHELVPGPCYDHAQDEHDFAEHNPQDPEHKRRM